MNSSMFNIVYHFLILVYRYNFPPPPPEHQRPGRQLGGCPAHAATPPQEGHHLSR